MAVMVSPGPSLSLVLLTSVFLLSCLTAGAEETSVVLQHQAPTNQITSSRKNGHIYTNQLISFRKKRNLYTDQPTSSGKKKDLPFRTREEAQAYIQVGTTILTAVKDTFTYVGTKIPFTETVKQIANIANLVPGLGSLVSACVNLGFALYPQENPLKELKKGFNEVNRKLESLSVNIAALRNDVKWYNYISVYSQDETKILNSWRRFCELNDNIALVSKDERVKLAKSFINFYETSAVENSVDSLYHYLTVKDTSLSGNLMDLVVEKFECHVDEVSRYSIYLNSLLIKGMTVNQLYYSMKNFRTKAMALEQASKMNQITRAHVGILTKCMENFEPIMEKDVKDVVTNYNSKDKKDLAKQIKHVLDLKYNWYNWVVVVMDKHPKYHTLELGFAEFSLHEFTVAVGRTYKTAVTHGNEVTSQANECFKDTFCESVSNAIKEQGRCEEVAVEVLGSNLNFIPSPLYIETPALSAYGTLVHISYYDDFVEVPKPFYKHKCKKGGYDYNFSLHYSEPSRDPCSQSSCRNGGTCRRLLDSTAWLCDCMDGFYGKTCENSTSIDINTNLDTILSQTMAELIACRESH